jgi:SET domain-containing protein
MAKDFQFSVKESVIHGVGLFTNVDVRKGKLYDYEGTEMKWSEYSGNHRNTYSLRRIGKIMVGVENNPCQYLNTSPDANCILKKRALYALRDICAGEELTLQKYYKRYELPH